MALVVAVGITENGEREVLGWDVGLTEDGPYWTEFLRSLVRRGLNGVLLVISDAHEGLKEAIHKAQQMVAALVRTIFAQPDKEAAHAQLAEVVKNLELRFPKAAELLRDAEHDILAYMAFPAEHWRQLHSTNPLERLMREIGRRTDVVGIFPNRAALIRLGGAVLMEQQDEWAAAPRRYFSQESMRKLYRQDELPETKGLLTVPEQ